MASGSSSSSSMFFGTIAADHIDLVMNPQQDSNFVLPTSLTPAQLHHHLVAPNLQLHGRVHNLPFKLKTRTRRGAVQRKVYLCPEPTCAHHNRSHALGDFGGLKKHYLRKHSNQKKHECNSCSKKYAVETDLKAHLKICGKKKYNCSCGAPFSRRSHFAFHQAFCDEEEHEETTNHPPTSDVGNNSDGSTSNNNRSILISSTTSDLPTFDMGNNNNNNSPSNNSVIGSTTPHLGPQISYIHSPFNSYPFIAPNQSQLSHFGTDQERLMTAGPSFGLNLHENTPAFFSPSSTQQNQFLGNFDIGFYTNLLMNNNVDLNKINFMGEGGIYGSEEGGSKSFSGRGDDEGLYSNPEGLGF
ncbi:hypothetical protein L6452_20816 [Arctium lappa]|uniref:Uncharacterized protein n=1 Tax=Arctium lappa TaxID=4217 RepID=A0ACB9BD80_ARCLA|nr:hypothetical protein L6452_20816 [Arctium lappa]